MIKCNFNGEPLVITVGKFGVLHKGHEALIGKLVEISQAEALKPAIFSFYPSPALFFSQDFARHGRIQKYSSIYKILTQSTANEFAFFMQKFDMDFANILPQDFIEFLSSKLNVKHIVIGQNFNFGSKRAGNVEVLKKLCKTFNIKLTVYDLLLQDGRLELSTTSLRNMIQSGKIEDFNSYLGFNQKYSISGVVQKGMGLARKLGFKTANVYIPRVVVMPKFGVYVCKVYYNSQKYKGIVNIGVKPTLNYNKNALAEVHILDFNQDIYGEKLTIELIKFIREEKKFTSIEDLEKQIASDVGFVVANW